MNDKARGPGETGAIQRAQLFAAAERLKALEKVIKEVDDLKKTMQKVIKAGHALSDTDVLLADRIGFLGARIDIANKRLRKLEEKK